MKKITSVVLALALLLSGFSLFSVNAAAETKDVSLRAYCEKYYLAKKSAAHAYKCKVKYNDSDNIKVRFTDESTVYTLKVRALKPTDKKPPVVKIYYVGKGKKIVIVKSLRFSVKDAGEVKFKDVNINLSTKKEVTVNNPFAYDYKFKLSDNNIIDIKSGYVQIGMKVTYTVKALNAGCVTVKVYIKGKGKCVGSFKITVGDFPARLNPKYKLLKLKYNPNGSSTFMTESHINLKDIILDKHAKAKYSLNLNDEKVVSAISGGLVYATGKGKVTAEVIETVGSKSVSVGKIEISVVSAKMAYVVKENAAFYDNGIFGNGDFTVFLNLTDSKTFSMKPTINEKLLNNPYTGSHFDSSDYTISYVSSDPKFAAVSSKGVVTAKKAGGAHITYTITFSDKSTYKNSCFFSIEKD